MIGPCHNVIRSLFLHLCHGSPDFPARLLAIQAMRISKYLYGNDVVCCVITRTSQKPYASDLVVDWSQVVTSNSSLKLMSTYKLVLNSIFPFAHTRTRPIVLVFVSWYKFLSKTKLQASDIGHNFALFSQSIMRVDLFPSLVVTDVIFLRSSRIT